MGSHWIDGRLFAARARLRVTDLERIAVAIEEEEHGAAGNVIAPNLISQVKPAYPQSARDAGIEGIVRIQGIIAADGSLIALRAVNNPDADLTKAAIEAAKQWRYRPALLNNEPIEVPTELEVEFKLVQ